METPLVSIVSVIYNQVEITCAMLSSLRKLTYPNIEVFIVDNDSPLEDSSVIKKRFPEVHLIKSEENLGFAGGNNLAVRQAKGKYVLFLNNDTEVDAGFLEPLVELFEHNPKAGVASPKIIYYGTEGIIQYAGCTGINHWTGRGSAIGSKEKDQGQYNDLRLTDLANGAAMMVPMEVIHKAGLMPEQYFLYYEEHDWCEMIKRAGYSCHYVGTSTIYHKESMSVGKGSVLKTYYLNRNRLLFMRRNLKGWQQWVSILFFLLVAIPKNSLMFGLQRQWKHLDALWRGVKWHLSRQNIHQNIFITR
ncbi:glycosyltransferase family 2 protein [Cytophagaceae bacterium YF14B1]|uniref:Glycosyltransferase family 2 protein n=1 Tax=Xanthocytophaga flava TaxID=3048013 RepID=A0AAE3U4D2_9BACT|nr:glycosyltransferase family 2 protein [Xanthocytophaga flavus]MDJ1479669.1 glycosyltransferase family 2 protein [Xanthocytophaga flavus]